MTTEDLDAGVETRYVVTVIHPVKDFDKWLENVRELDKVAGPYILSREAYQSLDDPNEILIQCEVGSEKAAMRYLGEEVMAALDRTGMDFYPPAFAGREIVDLRINRD